MKFAPLLLLFLMGCSDEEEEVFEVDPRIKYELLTDYSEFKQKEVLKVEKGEEYHVEFKDGSNIYLKFERKQ